MDLGGAGLAEHADEGPLGRAAHDRVVDHHQPLADDVLPDGVELHAHALGPLVLVGGDERAADVAVLDQAVPERDAGAASVPLRRGDPGLGHGHDHVGFDGGLLGQLLAHALAGGVHRLTVEPAVGAGEVDELEEAQPRVDALGRERVQRPGTGGVDHHHLAGLELAHEMGAHDVEGGRLRRQDPAGVKTPEAEGPEPVGVAHTDEVGVVHQHERERSPQVRQDLHECPLEVAAVASRLAAGHDG